MRLPLVNCDVPELDIEDVGICPSGDSSETSARSPFDLAFGPADAPGRPRFDVDIGDQPIGLPLTGLLTARGLPIPREYAAFEKRFALWVIPHRVMVRRLRGMHELVSLTMNIRYDADGGTCSIVSLFPEAQFLQVGSVTASAVVSATGTLGPLNHQLDAVAGVGGGLNIGVTGGVEAKIGFAATVATSFISAGGKGSSRCYWTFDRHDLPLFGRDIETWSVVVLSKRKRRLRLGVTILTTERLAFFPVSRSTAETWIDCQLIDGAGCRSASTNG